MKNLIPRKADRKRFRGNVEVRSLNGSGNFLANAIDLGQTGLQIFSRRFLAAGQPVELAFRNPAGAGQAEGLKIYGSITYARVETDGNIMGVVFARALNNGEIQSLERSAGVLR